MNWTKDSMPFLIQQAEKEFEFGAKKLYRITTIKWGYSDYEHTLNIDNKNVRKFVYEMSLEDFITDWMEHFNEHPDEDIIKIEPL